MFLHSCCCQVMLSESMSGHVKQTRQLTNDLLGRSSARSKRVRSPELARLSDALDAVHDKMRSECKNKLSAALATFFAAVEVAMAASAKSPSPVALPTEALDRICSAMATPPADLDMADIMTKDQFDDFSTWWAKNTALCRTLAQAMTCTQGCTINLEDENLLAFLAWRDCPFDTNDSDDLAEAWPRFRSAADAHVETKAVDVLSALYPRGLAPLAESVSGAQSLPVWEDTLTTVASAAFSDNDGYSHDVLASLRSVGCGVLQAWKLVNSSDNGKDVGAWRPWRVTVQKVVPGKGKKDPQIVSVLVDVDVAVIAGFVMSAYSEMAPVQDAYAPLANWRLKLTVQDRASLLKDFCTAFEAAKRVRTDSLPRLSEFVSKLSGIITPCSKAARSLLRDAQKSVLDKRLADVVSKFNSVVKHANSSLKTILGSYATTECNVPCELEQLCAENGVLDDKALARYVSSSQGAKSKELYQELRFGNEHVFPPWTLATSLCSGVEPWDSDDVKQVGRFAGSVTLMQGLATDPSRRADILRRTSQGLAMLGRGLMDGHSVVVARVNSTIASDSAAAAAATAAEQGPASKKHKGKSGP